MSRRIISIMLAAVISLSVFSAAMAMELGNKRKGKYIYRKVYQSCCDRGEAQSAKPVLDPDAKTQAEWTRIFEEKQYDIFGCKQEWNALPEQDIVDIYTYLHDHASDSPTPLKCKK